MKKLTFISVLFTLILSGCTSQVTPTDQTVAQNGSAHIMVIRDSSLWGAAFSAPIYVNQKYIGKVGNGGTINWSVQPGPVTVSTSEGTAAFKFEHASANSASVSFNAVKNKTYTIKILSPYQVNFVSPAYELKLMTE